MHGGVDRFCSTRFLCLLEPDGFVDPAFDCHVLPVLVWTRTVWLQRLALTDLDDALHEAKERLAAAACHWRSVNGPGQAFLLACVRIGCIPISAARLCVRDGRVMDLSRVPPAIVGKEVRAAVHQWTWRTFSAEMADLNSKQEATSSESAALSTRPQRIQLRSAPA